MSCDFKKFKNLKEAINSCQSDYNTIRIKDAVLKH